MVLRMKLTYPIMFHATLDVVVAVLLLYVLKLSSPSRTANVHNHQFLKKGREVYVLHTAAPLK